MILRAININFAYSNSNNKNVSLLLAPALAFGSRHVMDFAVPGNKLKIQRLRSLVAAAERNGV